MGEGNGTPLQYSCLENPMDGGAWWATVHGVAKSQTWLSDFNFTFHFHALEKEMATHSSILAWKIPWTEERGRPQSMGSLRVRHDWATSLSIIYFRVRLALSSSVPPIFSRGCSRFSQTLKGMRLWGMRTKLRTLVSSAVAVTLRSLPCSLSSGMPSCLPAHSELSQSRRNHLPTGNWLSARHLRTRSLISECAVLGTQQCNLRDAQLFVEFWKHLRCIHNSIHIG